MRVGIVVNNLTAGGAERQAVIWADMCGALGHDVTILALHSSPPRLDLPRNAHVEYAGKRRSTDGIRLSWRIHRWSADFDVIVAFQPYPALLCWAGRVRSPWIVVTGDDPRHHWSDRTVTRFPAGLVGRAFGAAELASAPTEPLVDAYTRLGVAPKQGWMTIPNVVDAMAFHERVDAGQGALFVGRLEPEKDPMLAVEAALASGVSLDLLGEGRLGHTIAMRLEHDGNASIQLLGYRSRPWETYATHRLLVVTSRYEAFGNVIVESLAAGTPVVAVDCDFGPRSILGGARYSKVVERSVGAVAAAMREIVSRPYTQAERDECRALADQYTAERVRPLLRTALELALAERQHSV